MATVEDCKNYLAYLACQDEKEIKNICLQYLIIYANMLYKKEKDEYLLSDYVKKEFEIKNIKLMDDVFNKGKSVILDAILNDEIYHLNFINKINIFSNNNGLTVDEENFLKRFYKTFVELDGMVDMIYESEKLKYFTNRPMGSSFENINLEKVIETNE